MSTFRIVGAAFTMSLAAAPALAGQIETVYQFQGGADGQGANVLVLQDTILYGQGGGGLPGEGICSIGCGTIFALNPQTGQKTTLYTATNPKHGFLNSFTASAGKGYFSAGNCIKRNGCLNGVLGQVDLTTGKNRAIYRFSRSTIPGFPTQVGFRNGTVYAYDDSGDPGNPGLFEYNLKSKSLVKLPFDSFDTTSPVTFLGKNVIGATYYNVFELQLQNNQSKTLYTFKGPPNDGASAIGAIYSDGANIFGATLTGGIAPPRGSGYGVIYKVNIASGKETILHYFDSSDGAYPESGLVYMNGKLYGTTSYGGANTTACGSVGFGTIFDIDPVTGTFTSLYQFQGGSDGLHPGSALTAGPGVLYGAAQANATANCGNCGLIFAFTP